MTPAALTPLLSESALNAIIVMPGYRLNLFGFLASAELQHEAESDGECAGNMGFWDQRVALEWTANNVGFFGGDAGNITVGGYSAGAHSAFHQLAHELYFVPENEAVIRRIIMWYVAYEAPCQLSMLTTEAGPTLRGCNPGLFKSTKLSSMSYLLH